MPPTTNLNQDLAKSGWLLRRSTVLKRWKQTWFILYRNGRLAYYEDQNKSTADELIDIPNEKAIVVGPDYCRDTEPPLGKSNDLLFGVKTNGKVWHMCADDPDDLLAWKLALQEALQTTFQNATAQNPGAGAYQTGYVLPSSNQNYGGGHQQTTIYAPPGSIVTVTDRGPLIQYPDGRIVYFLEQHPHNRYYSNNAGMGFLAGAAMGSMLFWPWWGLWWW